MDHEAVLAALAKNHLLSPGRTIIAATEICVLSLDGAGYRVINLVEQVGETPSPRDVRRAIVLKPNLETAYQLPYFPPAKPMSCHANVLVFSTPVEIDNTLPEGTQVSFANGAADAQVLPNH